tara:strand:- start:10345 stop:10599 length:255 start_codon:yes stop_codon:yes gene_type:complete
MDEMLIELLGGLGVLTSTFFYTKFQTNQNHKEILDLKKKLHDNEKFDATRDTKIAVMENQNSTFNQRITKNDTILEKIFEKINT